MVFFGHLRCDNHSQEGTIIQGTIIYDLAFTNVRSSKEVADMMIGLTIIALILAHPIITVLIIFAISFLLILPEILEELL